MIILSVLVWLLIYQKQKLFKKKIINPQDQLDDEGTIRGSSKLDDTDKELVVDFDFSFKESQTIGDMPGKIILTIIVILFLLHPTITREMFNLFKQAILISCFIVASSLKEQKDHTQILKQSAIRVSTAQLQSGLGYLHSLYMEVESHQQGLQSFLETGSSQRGHS
ncbi:hypothetical protein FGO68_gene12498 [Halteria grandinella]|uniref:Uncharacterized protein n=1 Tax=Halteria grandinella TaxID=5974 RepID=A0A8J8P4T9_HALGN|nr:hypothetical protein FGO68_gene12498 [Halteria grandinella]